MEGGDAHHTRIVRVIGGAFTLGKTAMSGAHLSCAGRQVAPPQRANVRTQGGGCFPGLFLEVAPWVRIGKA